MILGEDRPKNKTHNSDFGPHKKRLLIITYFDLKRHDLETHKIDSMSFQISSIDHVFLVPVFGLRSRKDHNHTHVIQSAPLSMLLTHF